MLSAAAQTMLETLGEEEARAVSRTALWRQGILTWALHDRQIADAAHVAETYRRGIRRHVRLCGRRYGKTRGMIVDVFEHCLRTPGARVPYAAMTWQSASDFVLPEAEYLIAAAPANEKPEIVGGDIRFPNGSVIVVAGCEDKRKANRLRGPRATRAVIDESAFIDVLDYVAEDVIAAQLLTTDGMLLMGTSAPESPAHVFCTRYLVDAKKRDAMVFARTEDAPHIARASLERFYAELGGPNSVKKRRECDCEIMVDEVRAVIPEMNVHGRYPLMHGDIEVAPPVVHDLSTVPRWRDWYVSADTAYNDLTVVLIGWVDFPNARLVVEDEAVLVRPNSADIQAAAHALEQKWVSRGDHVRSRTADAAGIVLAEMRSLQPKEADDRLYWRAPFKDTVEAGVNAVRLLVERHKLVVNPRCRTLIAHLEGAVWNTPKTDFLRTDVRVEPDGNITGGHFDALAALIYLVRAANLSRNPEAASEPLRHVTQRVSPGLVSRFAEDTSRGAQRWSIGGKR
jgi:hypothetical protein